MPVAQQFICKQCGALAAIETFEHTGDGVAFCRCPNCAAKNALVQTGATPSTPGIVPVTRLLD